MSTLKEQLLTVADEYGRARKLGRARVSTLVFNDGKIIGRLLGDGDLRTTRFESDDVAVFTITTTTTLTGAEPWRIDKSDVFIAHRQHQVRAEQQERDRFILIAN